MFFSSYHRLPLADIYDDKKIEDIHVPNSWWRTISAVLGVSLIASTLANALFVYNSHFRPYVGHLDEPSQYAGLRYDLLQTIDPDPRYFSSNRTTQDAAWEDERLRGSRLVVALDDDFVTSMGVPHAMRWPWNAEKGVYVIAAGHQIHCLRALRQWMNDKQDNKNESDMRWDYRHSIHCLNTLRETVMCFADDILLYTGRVHENVHYKMPLAGRGTKRMCRNWDALIEWSDNRSACYNSEIAQDEVITELDRYKYCPDGSQPWHKQIDG